MSPKVIRWLCLCYGLAVIFLACPYVLDRMDSRYIGGPIFYGPDRSHYVLRLEQALIDPRGNIENSIFSSPTNPPGLQLAGLERFGGFLLGWTGWNGASAMILLSVIFGATVIPLLQRLLVRTGVGEVGAFAGSLLYFFLFVGPLSRFIHQSWSMPLSLVALLFLWRFWERRTLLRAAIAGFAIGILPYSYYWSWTFLWTVAGLLFLFGLPELRLRKIQKSWGLFWLVLFVVAAPYFVHMFALLGNSVARDAAERSSLILSHGIESYPRSILTLLLAICAFSLFGRKSTNKAIVPIVCLGIASFVVLHQQFVHGQVISFSTHYYPYFCLSALLLGTAVIARGYRTPLAILSLLTCATFLVAAFLDYGGRNPLAPADDQHFEFQHFITLLPALDALPKQVVLTDLMSAWLIAADTKHDIAFVENVRHLLVSNTEYSERYCLSTLFAPDAHPEWVSNTLLETGRLGRARQEELMKERLAITTDACKRVRSNPAYWLRHYGVSLLLWDEKDHPEWVIDRSLFVLSKQGKGWSLWLPTYL